MSSTPKRPGQSPQAAAVSNEPVPGSRAADVLLLTKMAELSFVMAHSMVLVAQRHAEVSPPKSAAALEIFLRSDPEASFRRMANIANRCLALAAQLESPAARGEALPSCGGAREREVRRRQALALAALPAAVPAGPEPDKSDLDAGIEQLAGARPTLH